jgi:WD40 repeat protein
MAPPIEGTAAQIPLADVPGSKKFFEKALGIFVSPDGSRAVVARQKGRVGGKTEQFLELVDVKENASKGLTPLPPGTAVLDVLPEAGLVMYRPEIFGSGKNTLLTIAQFDGSQLTTIKQFEPYAHEEWGPNRDVEKAWFLGADRAMTLNHMGKMLTVWDIKASKALLNIPVGSWANLELTISPDRRLLAIIMKEGIALIDYEAGRHVATIPTDGANFNRVEFRSDNTRLAGQTWDSVSVWDLTNGKKQNEFFHDSLRPNGELAWAGDYLLSQNQYLFDVGRRIL